MLVNVLDQAANKATDILCVCKYGETTKYLYISEGAGDNLLQEDLDQGYVDYLNWSVGDTADDALSQNEGGMLMFRSLIANRPNRLVDLIRPVLDDSGLVDTEEVFVTC